MPNAAGGVADLTARTVGQPLSERLGQPVVIDNRPGAGGVVAGQTLASAPPNGYTVMVATNAHAIAPSLFRSLPYNPLRDFAPVAVLGAFPIALVVTPGSALRTVGDLLTRMRRDPAALNIGTTSVCSTQHLAAELFKMQAGVRVEAVSFPATPALVTALLRGDVDVAFEITGPILGQIRSGELRVLAVTSAERAANLPGAPTLRESGLPAYDVSSWNALVAPARTTATVVEHALPQVLPVSPPPATPSPPPAETGDLRTTTCRAALLPITIRIQPGLFGSSRRPRVPAGQPASGSDGSPTAPVPSADLDRGAAVLDPDPVVGVRLAA